MSYKELTIKLNESDFSYLLFLLSNDDVFKNQLWYKKNVSNKLYQILKNHHKNIIDNFLDNALSNKK